VGVWYPPASEKDTPQSYRQVPHSFITDVFTPKNNKHVCLHIFRSLLTKFCLPEDKTNLIMFPHFCERGAGGGGEGSDKQSGMITILSVFTLPPVFMNRLGLFNKNCADL
jgi:hypothetical protein